MVSVVVIKNSTWLFSKVAWLMKTKPPKFELDVDY